MPRDVRKLQKKLKMYSSSQEPIRDFAKPPKPRKSRLAEKIFEISACVTI